MEASPVLQRADTDIMTWPHWMAMSRVRKVPQDYTRELGHMVARGELVTESRGNRALLKRIRKGFCFKGMKDWRKLARKCW